MTKPIAVSVGDPAGIGPDIVLSYWRQHPHTPLRVYADRDMLQLRAQQLDIDFAYHDSALTVAHVPLTEPVIPGTPNSRNAASVMRALQQATDACLQRQCSALVTGPLHKASIDAAGIPFHGHTEWLANHCGVAKSVMLFEAPHLRLALATTHCSLREVPDLITTNALIDTFEIIDHDLKRFFGLSEPRLLVCGLNPHAGEEGLLGDEEQTTIKPAITHCQQQGLRIKGPVSADSAFSSSNLHQADVIVAMYHDQGLPVLKATDFGKTVNITLGLPIVRTSVDHGTAFALAGTGQACYDSFKHAVQTATTLSQHV